MTRPKTIEDLKAAPYNPRNISAEALTGLGHSVKAFGDLSGIVFNAKTGHLVAGHQRISALKAAGAVLKDNPFRIELGDKSFPVREVAWDDATEKAANITANNPHIAGEFSDAITGILDDLPRDALFDDLRLDSLASDFYVPDFGPVGIEEQGRLDQKEPTICPKCGHEWQR